MEADQPEEPEVQVVKEPEPKTDEVGEQPQEVEDKQEVEDLPEWMPWNKGHELYVARMQEGSQKALALSTFQKRIADGFIASKYADVGCGLLVSLSAVEAYCRLFTNPVMERLISVLDLLVEDNKGHHIIVFFKPNDETDFEGGYFVSDESGLLASVLNLTVKIDDKCEGDLLGVKITLGSTVFTVTTGDNSVVISTLPMKVSQEINEALDVAHVRFMLDGLVAKGLILHVEDGEGSGYSANPKYVVDQEKD